MNKNIVDIGYLLIDNINIKKSDKIKNMEKTYINCPGFEQFWGIKIRLMINGNFLITNAKSQRLL